MLRMELHMIHEASLRVLVISTTFLKEATAYGFCLSEIGEMMSRQFSRKKEEPSELEVVCMEAKKWVEEGEWLLPGANFEGDYDNEPTHFDLDYEDDPVAFEASFVNKLNHVKGNSKNPLSKLAKVNEDEGDNSEFKKHDADICTSPDTTRATFASKLLISPKKLSFSGRNK
uniref:1-phosphatidylinositol 4-kinase n=2 Tax=Oryza brachyantha TaxID=4533 RepID=J3MU11_ORYBR